MQLGDVLRCIQIRQHFLASERTICLSDPYCYKEISKAQKVAKCDLHPGKSPYPTSLFQTNSSDEC